MPQNTLYLVGWKFRERNKCIPILLRIFLSVMQYKVILIVLLHMLHLSSSLDLMIFNQLVFVVVIIEPVKGAGYSEGPCQTNKDAGLATPYVYPRFLKILPYNQCLPSST